MDEKKTSCKKPTSLDTKWEPHFQSPNVIKLHTRLRLKCGHVCIHCSDTGDVGDAQRRLIKAIHAIEGIEMVTCEGYEILIGKGEMFSWDELQPLILNQFTQYAEQRVKG